MENNNSTTIQPKIDIATRLSNIELKILEYEKEPLHKKVSHDYQQIGIELDSIKLELDELNQILDEPQKFSIDKSQDLNELCENEKFKIFVDKIERLNSEIRGNQSILNTEKVKIFLEMYSLIDWCKIYINKQKLHVIDI